jgi:sugar phosphate isomerase/epimerase
MKLSFATLGCPNWNLEKIAAEAARIGFDGVELRGQPGEHIGATESPESRRAIRDLFKRHGVAIAAIMGYSHFTAADADARRKQLDATIAMAQLAHDVGCPVLRIFGGKLDGDRAAGVERVASALKEAGKAAGDLGVKLALETHDDWCEGRFLAEVLATVDSPAVGACWDVGNSYFFEPAEVTWKEIGSYVFHVHFKDAAKTDKGTHSVLPGTGQVDMRKALRLLRDGGYTGYLSFEWEKKWEPDLAEPEIAFPHYRTVVKAMMKEEGIS